MEITVHYYSTGPDSTNVSLHQGEGPYYDTMVMEQNMAATMAAPFLAELTRIGVVVIEGGA